jgi:hypothetical protein
MQAAPVEVREVSVPQAFADERQSRTEDRTLANLNKPFLLRKQFTQSRT